MDSSHGWERYAELLPPWFTTYLDLEQSTSHIRSHDAEYLPGLFQTADCARSIIAITHDDPDAVDRRVDLRIRRQRLLATANSPIIHAVIRENVLTLPALSTVQRHEQLDLLIELAARPRITVQILPADSDVDAETFSILAAPGGGQSDVVYLERPDDADYLQDEDDVARYAALMDRLCAKAHPAEHTSDILRCLGGPASA